MTTSGAAAEVAGLLERGLLEAQRRSGLPVAFGGLVEPGQRHFAITSLRGASTTSLANLRVYAGEGLGGVALAQQRPVQVLSYPRAKGITRRYEHAVAPERLQSILSVPVGLPGRSPLAVLYLATREELAIGDVVHDQLRPLVTRLAHDLQVAVDVDRRLSAVRRDLGNRADPPAPAVPLVRAPQAQRPDVRGELADLMASTTDGDTRARLQDLLLRMDAATPRPPAGARGGAALPAVTSPVADGASPSPLTRRETEVLVEVDRGASNLQVALALGLNEGTVKSYMKAVLAKLGVENRVQACRVARERGHLP